MADFPREGLRDSEGLSGSCFLGLWCHWSIQEATVPAPVTASQLAGSTSCALSLPLPSFSWPLGGSWTTGQETTPIWQLGEQGSPTTPQDSCTLGGTLKSDSCPVVFKLVSFKLWDSVEGPQAPPRVGMGELGWSKGYTKQARFLSHPLHSPEQSHFYLVYVLDLHIKF